MYLRKLLFISVFWIMFTQTTQTIIFASSIVDYNYENWPELMPISPIAAEPEDTEPVEEIIYTYAKGIQFLESFPNVPSFLDHARILDSAVKGVQYPLITYPFFYFEAPDISFVFQSQIFDYMEIGAEKFSDYQTYLTKLGFSKLSYNTDFNQALLGDYYSAIDKDLLYDPDFTISPNNVYFIGDDTEFTAILFGTSVTYANSTDPVVVSCDEIRIYSLQMLSTEGIALADAAKAFSLPDLQRILTLSEKQIGIPISATIPNVQSYMPIITPGTTVTQQPPAVNTYIPPVPVPSGQTVTQPLPNVSTYQAPGSGLNQDGSVNLETFGNEFLDIMNRHALQ